MPESGATRLRADFPMCEITGVISEVPPLARLAVSVIPSPVRSFAPSPMLPARVLIPAEPHGPLYTARYLLEQCGHPTSMVYEEGHALATILHAGTEPLLLLCASHPSALLCVPRLLASLRRFDYPGEITFCSRELTPARWDTYQALAVDRCLQPDGRASVPDVVAWLEDQTTHGRRSLSIFEV